MPQIIPVTDLEDTEGITELCRRSREPVFLTRDGYGVLVLMEIGHYMKSWLPRPAWQGTSWMRRKKRKERKRWRTPGRR